MNQLATMAIVLARTNYGEADRILTVLTPDYGKLRLMAKGVRRVKSKLAGGIELFSVSDITFIKGRGDISTLVSSRLKQHYGSIVNDLARVQLGYDLIKLLNAVIEDDVGADYFSLLEHAFIALDDQRVAEDLVRAWFSAQLLRMDGHMPNLHTDVTDTPLSAEAQYDFDFDSMALRQSPHGRFTASHIKFLRLFFSGTVPRVLQQVSGYRDLLPDCLLVIQTMLNTFVRI